MRTKVRVANVVPLARNTVTIATDLVSKRSFHTEIIRKPLTQVTRRISQARVAIDS